MNPMREGLDVTPPVSAQPSPMVGSRKPEPPARGAAGAHRFYDRPVTAELTRELTDAGIDLLLHFSTAYQNRDRYSVARCRRQVTSFLGWLQAHPGGTWQHQWDAAEASMGDIARTWSREFRPTVVRRQDFWRGLEATVALGAFRPSYRWLTAVSTQRLWSTWITVHEVGLVAEIRQRSDLPGTSSKTGVDTVRALTRMSMHTGRPFTQLTVDDMLELRAASLLGRHQASFLAIWHAARGAGLFPAGPADLIEVVNAAQLSPEDFVAFYGVRSAAVGQVIADYLRERSTGVDYSTLVALARVLLLDFWCDLEAHHPGIESLSLTREQAQAWMARSRTTSTGKPRARPGDFYGVVRAFYLDLSCWAHEDPAKWARWAVPCPIPARAVRTLKRDRRRTTAAIHDRIRAAAPLLPALMASAKVEKDHAAALLALAKSTPLGESFTVEGCSYRRIGSPRYPTLTKLLEVDTGQNLNPRRLERDTFWAWACMEVLRHTGIRVEELSELTHFSLRQYRQPDGTQLPLLQIAPSKTDLERVLPVSPELAHILAVILTRHVSEHGHVPLSVRWDHHERTASLPLPHLVQFREGGRSRCPGSWTIRMLITRAVGRAGLTEADGSPLRLTPHDFRRLFATEAVNSGLPIHIAARLLGHLDLNTTSAYVAVYPTAVFAAYREFIDHRRAQRPDEEYREPSPAELAEFEQHFLTRRNELGRCDRPYATDCAHEHACIRCPFQRVDPERLDRLRLIENNITERITEAEDKAWLADLTQLQRTLSHLREKKETVLTLLATQGQR